jgi:deoxyribodipyrimidine photo-lyase
MNTVHDTREILMPTTIVWYANNLRVDDQPALIEAASRGSVVPVYVYDPDYAGPSAMGGASKWWAHRSIEALRDRLKEMGSNLILRKGEPGAQLLKIAESVGADRVMYCESIEPDLQLREDDVEHTLGQHGIEVERFNMHLLWEIGSVMTKDGNPYQVFSPFWKMALKTGEPDEPLDAPTVLHAPDTRVESLGVDELGLLPDINWYARMEDRWTPGLKGARDRLSGFLNERINNYHDDRNRLDLPGWSAMSPHIHFGEVSVRRIWHTIAQDPEWSRVKGKEHYLREIGWREFAQHLINHFPRTIDEPLREKFKDFPWVKNPEQFDKWKRGETGYPVVDAAMRNLWAEGWMPNRARMIVASFLCKDLRISWEEGMAWFWDTLVDADLGSNTLGWQWTAGCGADAAPYFRVFNPVSQGTKFDPDGEYVRAWCPELGKLAKSVVHEPWTAKPMELAAAGVTLGEDYPEPMVDHKVAREEALEAFEKIKD